MDDARRKYFHELAAKVRGKGTNDSDRHRRNLIATWEFADAPESVWRYSSTNYETDLNCTMRAARRLPLGSLLGVNSAGVAFIYIENAPQPDPQKEFHTEADGDPARAAFLALSDYLAKEPP